MIGFLVSLPVAYYMVTAWLDGFAYHVDLEWWMAAMAGILALLLTLFTVGFQSIRAARLNPIQSIKTE
jgi:putative ABC transport system permease protein